MRIDFDINTIQVTDFGIGVWDDEDNPYFGKVSTNPDVQETLCQMARDTIKRFDNLDDSPELYSAAELYGSTANLYLPLDNEMAVMFNDLHTAVNLPLDRSVLDDKDFIFCYFARFKDAVGRRITGVRRAIQFKSIGNRVMGLLDDQLAIVDGPLFRLDSDFTLITDRSYMHILRPKEFEFIARLQEHILGAVSHNISVLRVSASNIDWDLIEDYAANHPRAARYVSSIRSQRWAENLDRDMLLDLCQVTGVSTRVANGRISVEEGDILDFLQVIERRRYGLELVRGRRENYVAANRRSVNR